MRRDQAERRGRPIELPETVEPGREDIAERAYALYLERGAADGHDMADWLEAERQLRTERRGQLATV